MKFNTLQELFSDKKRWIKGDFARDKNGKGLPSKDKNAVCWCLLGAVNKVYREFPHKHNILSKLNNSINKLYPNFYSIEKFNDNFGTTIEDIRKVVKDANV